MELKVAICDDEQIISEKIKRIILSIKPKYKVDIYNDGKELLNKTQQYDLIFLDYEMPTMDGMTVARMLREKNSDIHIIFLTSHVEVMPDTFKVKAFRFLNKPIEMERFEEALIEAGKEIEDQEIIEIKRGGNTRKMYLKDVVYFEAFGDGTYIYTANEVLTSNKQLKYWVENIGENNFFQIHKSYFIAMRYVAYIENSQVKLKHIDKLVPVSRRKIVAFKKMYKEYMKKASRFM